MKPLLPTLLLILHFPLASAFLLSPQPSSRLTTSLHGLSEWREDALSSSYTLDAYTTTPSHPQTITGTVPILPFPFNDILLPGQTKQLNLYEERFHLLFDEATTTYNSVIGMGLLSGNSGMMTLLPLLEIESFTRKNYDPRWRSKGDGMGNGEIIVTVRCVGRAKIVSDEGGLEQEEPFMKAKVVEVVDEKGLNGVGLVKEKGGGVEGETGNELEVGSLIAGNIEMLILSLAGMEHRWNEWKVEMSKKREEKAAGVIRDENGKEISRAAVNAQLEALFNKDTIPTTGVSLETNESHDENKSSNDKNGEADMNDRRSRYFKAFEDAKIADTQGYISQNIDPSKSTTIRSLKDLTAISWAVFCTDDVTQMSEQDEIQHNVFKIQALDHTNVLQRLNLGAAMLRMEMKKLKAKLALAGKGNEEKEEEI
ncbi:hypothetical protein ACHAWO_002025 [Cyclotella atomus]|uniref:Uncharacterized protein n=1 Tax=Cyclotella atomus TaxID=382360 RepID=A0ABD3PQJ4_9STRA